MMVRMVSHRPRNDRGFTIVEMMVSSLIAIVILVAVYQTMRLQWRNLSMATEEAGLLSESKRLLAQVTQTLRNAGYNPTATPYDTGNDPTRRIGIVAAYADAIVVTSDTLSPAGAVPDGRILTATTLDARLMPVAGKTDAREVTAYRLRDGGIEWFTRIENRDAWVKLANGVNRFLVRYIDDKGEPLSNPKASTDPTKLKTIRRLDISLELSAPFRGKALHSEATTSLTLRNPAFLTPQEAP